MRHIVCLLMACVALLAAREATALIVWPAPVLMAPSDDAEHTTSLVVINDTIEPARDVVVIALPGAGTDVVASDWPFRFEGGEFVWTIGELGPGENVAIEVQVAGTGGLAARVHGRVAGQATTFASTPAIVSSLADTHADALASSTDAEARDPSVLAAAARLAGDPDRIEDFVRNEIGHELYRGSLRGARGALWGRAGNAVDRASLHVALLRASGIPARFERATLDAADVTSLVDSAFPEPFAGIAAPLPFAQVLEWFSNTELMHTYFGVQGTAAYFTETEADLRRRLYPEPSESEALRTAAGSHASVAWWDGVEWVRSETLLAAPPAGATPGFDLGDVERHSVELVLRTESFNTLFGLVTTAVAEPVRLELPSAEVAGLPLTVRFRTNTRTPPGMVFGVIHHVYTPEIWIGDRFVTSGSAFEELMTSFPGGTQILSAVYLDVTLRSPDQPDVVRRHVLVDRVGMAGRTGVLGSDSTVPLASTGDPALRDMDTISVYVMPGRVGPQQAARAAWRAERLERSLGAGLDALTAQIDRVLDGAASADERDTTTKDVTTYGQRIADVVSDGIAYPYFEHSDAWTQIVARFHLVHAWVATPRAVIVSVRATDTGPAPLISLIADDVAVGSHASVPVLNEIEFRTVRGRILASTEGDMLRRWLPDDTVLSWDTLRAAADELGIGLRLITPNNIADLYRLPLPADAMAAVALAIGREQHVLVFEAPVPMGEGAWVQWLETDPRTGFTISRDPSGGYLSASEYAFIGNTVSQQQGIFMGFFPGFSAGVLSGIANFLSGVLAGGKGAAPPSGLGPALPCAVSAVPIPGNYGLARDVALGGAQSAAAGNPIDFMKAAFFTALQKIPTTKLATGYAALATGLDIGFCAGSAAGSEYVASIANYVNAQLDPDLPIRGRGWFPRPLRAVESLVRWDAEPSAAAAVSPEGLRTAPHVRGALQIDASEATFVGGTLLVTGSRSTDGVVHGAGSWRLAVEKLAVNGLVRIEGLGAAAPVHTGIAADIVGCDVGLSGAIEVFGTLAGDSGARWHSIADASGTLTRCDGPVALDGAATIAIDGTLWDGATAWDGVAGTLVGRTFAGTATASISVHAASSLRGAAGESLRVVPTFASSSGDLLLASAVAPAGWIVDVRDGELRIDLPADAEPGAHEVVVYAMPAGSRDVLASVAIAVTVEAPTPSLELDLAWEPLLTTGVETTPTPLVVNAELRYRGPATTFALEASTDVPGFRVELPVAQWTTGGGAETLSLRLLPDGDDVIPPPGTPMHVRLALTNGELATSEEVNFVMPEVPGLRLTPETTLVRLVEGETAPVTVLVERLGHGLGAIELRAIHSRSIAVSGVPATPEAERQSSFALTLGRTEHSINGLMQAVRIEAWDGERLLAATTVQMLPIGPDENRLRAAADQLLSDGWDGMGNAVYGLLPSAGQIEMACTDVAVNAFTSSGRSLVAQMQHPSVQDLRTELEAALDAVAAASFGCDAFDLLALTELIERIAARMASIRARDFTVSLTPRSANAVPGETVTYTARVERLGSETGPIRLTLEGVTGVLPATVTPEPVLDDIAIEVTAPAGRTTFDLVARDAGDENVTRRIRAQLLADTSWVRIAAVGTTSAFAIPGARLRTEVRVFNQLNVPLDALATLTLRRDDGSVVYTSAEPSPIQIAPVLGEQIYELDVIPTYGEPAGTYLLEVALTMAGDGRAIPGGEGAGPVLLGAPVDVALGVTPNPLPPGSVLAGATTRVSRRPLNVLPGLGNAEEIVRMTSEGNGPNSVVVGPDGSIYYSNFGTRRDSTEPGYLADNTVGRITPDGIVETFAVLDNGVTAMALGPDGHLYVVTINARDRIWRVTLPEGDVSLYFDFADTPANVRGDNILGIAFGASGEIYATDYLENFIFGINFPGRSLYRVFPDADSNGRADGAELMSSALDYPVRLVFDPRTGDLIVNDSGRNRLVRFNTSGPPVLEVALTTPTLGAIFLHPSGHLLGFNDDGELLAFATDVSSGRTVILPEPRFVASGFYAPLDLTIDGAGNFVIPHFEDSEIIRLVMTPERPAEPVLLSLEHQTEPGAVTESIMPADGVWSGTTLRWTNPLAPGDDELAFVWNHALSDLVPGQTAALTSSSSLQIEQGDASFTWEHGPLLADVGRMIGLSPSTRMVPRGSGQEVTVSVRNPLPVATTMTLAIDPLPEGLRATLPVPFTVNPGATVTRTIAFVAAGELPDPSYSYTVRVSEPGGAQDAATGYLELTDAPLRVEVLTPELSGTRGGSVQLRFRATRAPGDTRRAFYVQARGLDAVRGDSININTQLIDFYLTDGTVERTVSIPLRGRAGTYTFHLLSMPQENGGQYAPVEGAVGRITIVDDAHIPITVEPLLLRTPRGSQWSVEGAFTNHSNQARRLRVTACCGAIWGRVFDGGPFLMQPYETRRVTITGASGSLGVGPYAHEFRVVDVDDSTFSGVFTHTVEVVDTAFTMTTLPEPVLVADGTASFNVRIQRGGSPRPAIQVAVSGPLTGGIDMPTTTIAEGGVFGTDLPVTLRGLEGFGRGPWPVYVTAWRVDAPDVIARRTIWLTIPAGDLSGSFDPERLILRPDESQTVLLTLRNDDLEESTAASLTWTAPGLAIHGLPEAVELLPGAERVVAIDVGAVDIGETALIVSLDYGGDRVDTLTLPVDVRANELPTAPTPVAPVDTTVGADVLFEWTEAADPEGDALVYTIEVLDTDDNEVFGLSLEATSTSTRLPYGNYRWRVRAADRYGAGDWSEWAAFVADRSVDNRAPAAPIIVAPENDATDVMRPVDVVWELAVDPDGDALLYTIEVSQTDDFASLFFVLDDIPASDDETITASVDGLGPGERWLARVRASDGLLTSDWSVVAFTTNNPPPSTPVLIAPVDGERVETGEIALRFSTADDFDGQALRYVAAVYGDAERTEELWRGDGGVVDDEVVAAYDATGELGARFWSAWAIDELGAESEPAAVEEFNVGVEPSNNAPTAPTLLDPADGATVAPGDVELSWSAATDPDGDALTHTVWLLDGDGSELMRQTLDSDAPTLTWTVSAEAAGTYTWSVFATDARGLDGAEATPRTFVVTDPGEDAGGDAGADAGDTGNDAGADAGTDADLPDVNEVDASTGPDADSGDDTTGGFGTAKNAGCCGVAGSGPRDAALWFVVGIFLLARRRSFARAA